MTLMSLSPVQSAGSTSNATGRATSKAALVDVGGISFRVFRTVADFYLVMGLSNLTADSSSTMSLLLTGL